MNENTTKRSAGPIVLFLVAALFFVAAGIMATSTMHIDGDVSCGSLVSKVEPQSTSTDLYTNAFETAGWETQCGHAHDNRRTQVLGLAIGGVLFVALGALWLRNDGTGPETVDDEHRAALARAAAPDSSFKG